MRTRILGRQLFSVALITVVSAFVMPGVASAATPPSLDPFYKYTGSTPLSSIAPGTALKSRTVPYKIVGLAVPLKTTQILYRSTGQLGQPTTNVTSVVQPLIQLDKTKVVSYQSIYDSLNPEDEPSYAISGNVSLTGIIPGIETLLFSPFLLDGYTVVISDTEGQKANFAAGREYGYNTIDSIRAAFKTSSVGLPSKAKVSMIGYSGGAIATEWAAELAPTYAPDVNSKLVGAAMGGVLVSPAHNLHYVDGTTIWAGVEPMALIGAARAFNIDLQPYLSAKGVEVYNALKNASIINVLGQYSGLTWAQMAKPEYAQPESVPVYVNAVNQLIMGTGGRPTIPLMIGQGANGELEGTPGTGPYGKGDGVMIAGDVRTLARQYCAKGTKVHYTEYANLSHIPGALAWLPAAISWVKDRHTALDQLLKLAPSNCSSIAPGNSLAPIPTS